MLRWDLPIQGPQISHWRGERPPPMWGTVLIPVLCPTTLVFNVSGNFTSIKSYMAANIGPQLGGGARKLMGLRCAETYGADCISFNSLHSNISTPCFHFSIISTIAKEELQVYFRLALVRPMQSTNEFFPSHRARAAKATYSTRHNYLRPPPKMGAQRCGRLAISSPRGEGDQTV